jgi:1-phosphofructokinase family hexose kinase
VAVGAATRSNITLTEPDGTTTKVNAPGAPLAPGDVDALLGAAAEAVATTRATWLVGCGSLPVGAPTDLHARLVEVGHAAGVPVAVDATGPALLAAVEAGADLVKPNREELEEVLGRRLADLAEVIDGARDLRRRGVGTVVVSLGAEGALLVDDSPPTLAVPPPVQARSTVGAGDTLLAGYLGSLVAGHTPASALAVAVAWGAAAAALPGTQVPGPADVHPERVTTSTLPSSTPAPSSPAA